LGLLSKNDARPSHVASRVPAVVVQRANLTSVETSQKKAPTNEVFLVHGHNEADAVFCPVATGGF
jgi:hypothetical protein